MSRKEIAMTHLQDQRPEYTPPNESGPDALAGRDDSEALCEQVARAQAERATLRIVGGNTKAFYGRRVETAQALSTTGHHGIVHYDPVELVATVRAGTRLRDLERALADNGQRLAFEPPHFGEDATVGGMVAAGLSGPRRPWVGAVRDFVLGVRVITSDGKQLRFGGEVMKNVAGYDLSRLMVGAQGTLGVLTEVSFKVLPIPHAHACLRLELPLAEAFERLTAWGREPMPITGAAHDGEALHLRLEGGEGSVSATRQRLGGEPEDSRFWAQLRELQLPFFDGAFDDDAHVLWRLSLPALARTPALEGDWLVDWAGAQRWLKSSEGRGFEDEPRADAHIHEAAIAAGGHATRFTSSANGDSPFTPLPPVLAKYHRQLKQRLDPQAIFNPGRLYAEW
ncbi:glycolate oxidase subunit GlcE [uncultured Salinicola sp.]|uniref:glycolate oxidase subunit GlcE n=1 Tax=uncultured Salinicola sp. TaxID=1193542 RepID=UPI0026252C23|nr:glycolate oxidase subunit GlcE [uncultured Salinicola sp.]